ncbi:MAG: lysophospholipase [Anaerolineaceae bacterium]|nr:lysophospholipase [Anaerolineaceae bacterium]
MKHETGYWVSENQENIFFQTWAPDKTSKGCIFILHGLGEHSARYAHVAAWFAERQYLVQSFDLPGHGKSDGIRGHAESFAAIHNIANHFISDLNTAYPDIPIIIYGHSMGGELALDYGFENSHYVDGIISSSPGLIPGNPPSKIIIALSGILQAIIPKYQIDNNLPLDGLSRDQKVIDDYNADPLVHNWVSMRIGSEIINRGRWIIDHADQFPEIPLLLQIGEKDILVSPEGVLAFARNKNVQECKVWSGFFHELHNEPEQEKIFECLYEWIIERKVIRH